jgi:5'-nucleotidase (lipoprotein e(P4) family)
MTSRILFACAVVVTAGCAPRSSSPAVPVPDATATTAAPARPHENLNAVVWMQTALEYEASALQAYRLAERQLDEALRDPSWTAALEQTVAASTLPPAVILDIDETVLDNSPFQARMVRDNTAYAEDSWSGWVHEKAAPAIPGAKAFTDYAAKKGVTVFFISNRTAAAEPATRANLEAQGFVLDAHLDTVLMRGERPEWVSSPKGPRRAHVAASYRVLLLIGDDLGDFVVNAAGTPDERRTRTAANADWWGRRWIMLPNPTYGSWERAVIGADRDPIDAKRRALRVK